MPVMNLRASQGVYTWDEFGYTYQYFSASNALYRKDPVSGNFNLQEVLTDVLKRSQILQKLQSGVSSGVSTEPLLGNLSLTRPGEPGHEIEVGDIATFPKLTPNLEPERIGTIPYNQLHRFTGIGRVPQLMPIIWSMERRPVDPNPLSQQTEFVNGVREVVQQSPQYFPGLRKRVRSRRSRRF